MIKTTGAWLKSELLIYISLMPYYTKVRLSWQLLLKETGQKLAINTLPFGNKGDLFFLLLLLVLFFQV